MVDTQLLWPAVLGLAIAAFVGGAILWSRSDGGRVEREQQERFSRERAGRVRAQGWRYDERAEGDIRYRIHGTTSRGVAWLIEYDSDHSSSSPRPKLNFRAAALAQPSIAWQIGDRKAYDFVRSRFGRVLTGALVGLIAGLSNRVGTMRDFMQQSRELPSGSGRFRERFVLWGTDATATRLIDAETERLVLHWPDFKPSYTRRDNCFTASLSSKGLEVRIACDGPSFQVIEHLARLGQILADRCVAR